MGKKRVTTCSKCKIRFSTENNSNYCPSCPAGVDTSQYVKVEQEPGTSVFSFIEELSKLPPNARVMVLAPDGNELVVTMAELEKDEQNGDDIVWLRTEEN